ncbi:putative glycosyltransferase [Lentibacillus sp. JNUCC-1]|nr:putative glycosyltransferase [Lentibacillus sp. JNUCC-1]
MISVVVPVYGCNACLEELTSRLASSVQPICKDYEIILINDASPDGAWKTIKTLNKQNKHIKGINLARNFGQHHAITAGLDVAVGDWVVVMDCDLQDAPEDIPALYEKAQEGFDVVLGQRESRQDSWMKRLSSRMFYKVYDYFAGTASDHSIANFCILSKEVVHGFRQMREQNRLFPMFIQWLGFETAAIPVHHQPRESGKSSYNIRKRIALAADAIIAQSNKPLRLSIQIGFLISFISFLFGVYLFARYFFLDVPVKGWTSVMVSIYFISGLIFSNFGVLGLYMGKIFNETKGRPIYLVREVTDNRPHQEEEGS